MEIPGIGGIDSEDFVHAVTHVAAPDNEPPGVVRRRRIVVAVTLVVGAAVLGYSLRRHPGESSFYPLTTALAAVWLGGALLSGPLHLGGIRWHGRIHRPVIAGTSIGLLIAGVFVLGGLVVRRIPLLSALIDRVVSLFAHHGSVWLVIFIAAINGAAEEIFFRGSLYTALGSLRYHPVLVSTILYAVVTIASGNAMLGFAAIVLGTVCAFERRATGGVLAPVLTHVVWGPIMVLALPRIFGI